MGGRLMPPVTVRAQAGRGAQAAKQPRDPGRVGGLGDAHIHLAHASAPTTFDRVPPPITPGFTVRPVARSVNPRHVCSSRASSSMAECPRSKSTPVCDATPRTSQPVVADALARGLAGQPLRRLQHQHRLGLAGQPLGDRPRDGAAHLLVASSAAGSPAADAQLALSTAHRRQAPSPRRPSCPARPGRRPARRPPATASSQRAQRPHGVQMPQQQHRLPSRARAAPETQLQHIPELPSAGAASPVRPAPRPRPRPGPPPRSTAGLVVARRLDLHQLPQPLPMHPGRARLRPPLPRIASDPQPVSHPDSLHASDPHASPVPKRCPVANPDSPALHPVCISATLAHR